MHGRLGRSSPIFPFFTWRLLVAVSGGCLAQSTAGRSAPKAARQYIRITALHPVPACCKKPLTYSINISRQVRRVIPSGTRDWNKNPTCQSRVMFASWNPPRLSQPRSAFPAAYLPKKSLINLFLISTRRESYRMQSNLRAQTSSQYGDGRCISICKCINVCRGPLSWYNPPAPESVGKQLFFLHYYYYSSATAQTVA